MRKLLFAVPFALLMLKTSTASAVGASAAVLIGNGFEDVYKLGVGARGGFTLPMSFYIGGTFVYHFGTTEGGSSVNLFYFGPEAGYDISAGPVIVRPYLGLGYSSVRATVDFCAYGVCNSVSGSDGRFTVWPGVTGLFPIGSLFVGADLRVVVPIDAGDKTTAFAGFLTAGMSF